MASNGWLIRKKKVEKSLLVSDDADRVEQVGQHVSRRVEVEDFFFVCHNRFSSSNLTGMESLFETVLYRTNKNGQNDRDSIARDSFIREESNHHRSTHRSPGKFGRFCAGKQSFEEFPFLSGHRESSFFSS